MGVQSARLYTGQSGRAAWSLALLMMVLFTVSFAPVSASWAQDDTPEDVAAAFSAEALDTFRETAAAEQPDLAKVLSGELRFGVIHRVHAWVPAFIAGSDASTVAAPIDEWIASVVAGGGEQLGVFRVWRPAPDATAEFASLSVDAVLAGELSGLSLGVLLVEDPTNSGWYALRSGAGQHSVFAVNAAAAEEVSEPVPADRFMPILAKRYADAERAASGQEASGGAGSGWASVWGPNGFEPSGAMIAIGATGLAAIVMVIVGIALAVRNARRSAARKHTQVEGSES